MSTTNYQVITAHPRGDKRAEKGSVIRREGFIPAVIFGAEMDSVNVKISKSDWLRFSQKNQVIFNAAIEGGDTHLVALKQIDKTNMGAIEHIALHKMKKGQKASVTIPVNTFGEKHKNNKGIIFQHISELTIEAIPSEVPESVEIDISNLMDGESVSIKDLKLGKTVEIQGHEDDVTIVECQISNTTEEHEVSETEAVEGETSVAATEETKE